MASSVFLLILSDGRRLAPCPAMPVVVTISSVIGPAPAGFRRYNEPGTRWFQGASGEWRVANGEVSVPIRYSPLPLRPFPPNSFNLGRFSALFALTRGD